MKALITGVLGQDGSYLAEQLAAGGHDVWGMTRRPTPSARTVIGDLLDQDSLERVLLRVKPDVVFNLAAVTAPGGAWGAVQPPLLAEVTALGVVKLLDAMVKVCPTAHLVHASSSAIYDPQRYGLYGIAKEFAHQAVKGYRKRISCSNAVLFSHTSPRQSQRFLARRITAAVARMAAGSPETLTLGDVNSRRDWGYAPDYMRALPLMVNHPGDWVIATGVTHSVRDLAETALAAVGLDWDTHVVVDPDAPRVPDEVHGEAHEARIATAKLLGWKPATSFADMIRAMVTT